jgi:predicted DNA-binding ribbon-helix-helix protein
VANNWEEFNYHPTLCFPCWKIFRREAKSQNLSKPDKRSLNKTGRIHQLGTRVRKDFLKKLRKIAKKEKLKYVEVLEKALDYYAERK